MHVMPMAESWRKEQLLSDPWEAHSRQVRATCNTVLGHHHPPPPSLFVSSLISQPLHIAIAIIVAVTMVSSILAAANNGLFRHLPPATRWQSPPSPSAQRSHLCCCRISPPPPSSSHVVDCNVFCHFLLWPSTAIVLSCTLSSPTRLQSQRSKSQGYMWLEETRLAMISVPGTDFFSKT